MSLAALNLSPLSALTALTVEICRTRALIAIQSRKDRFYEISKSRKMLPTAEEIEIASGRKVFTSRKDLMTFIDTCASTADKRQQTLRESFARAEKKLSPSARGINPNSNNSSVSSPPRIRQGVADGFNLIGCLDLQELLIDFQDLG
ncbi:hypothetical protein B0H11DRAFT_2252812 [Mycena galericulata]|nr:hypothetical protein B0H11DRAFT_2252812 [Mycena galericulata]